ncbi:hypothetical protein HED60_11810 [Planctomycetales bacterium ZRK34]|nr:hypothetical protein HED60_11810 [Planctomycetales bacterium ZRK34]
MKIARQNIVTNLKQLYAVMIGVALSLALMETVVANQRPLPFKIEQVPLLGCLIVLLVPFYHGALRHLDFTYSEKSSNQIRAGALLIDFLILFAQACVFVIAAAFLGDVFAFSWTIVILLVTDSLWGLLAHFAFTHRQDKGLKPEIRWTIINLITAALMASLMLLLPLFGVDGWQGNSSTGIVLLIFVTCRTIIDYWWCWRFYYPIA